LAWSCTAFSAAERFGLADEEAALVSRLVQAEAARPVAARPGRRRQGQRDVLPLHDEAVAWRPVPAKPGEVEPPTPLPVQVKSMRLSRRENAGVPERLVLA
jgi:hypothetical protein